MEFGQLTECNMRNNFVKKHTQNVLEKIIPIFVSKKSKLSISLNQ